MIIGNSFPIFPIEECHRVSGTRDWLKVEQGSESKIEKQYTNDFILTITLVDVGGFAYARV